MRCPRPDCGWHAVAPSEAAAREQLAEHVVAEHAREADPDETIPEGMVQVRVGEDDEWKTVTVEEAKALHEAHHDD